MSANIHLQVVVKQINSTLDLPGSKSIANRVLLLAAVAHGVSIIHNVPDVAEDVVLMLEALHKLGIKMENLQSNTSQVSSYKIYGCGGKFPVNNAELFCGNSGTTIRFLAATLSLMTGSYSLTGIERMKERPINDLIVALAQIGANIKCQEKDGYPPLLVGNFQDNDVEFLSLSGRISSQYLTGVLMAVPHLKRKIMVNIHDELISKPYVEITLALLAKFGVKVKVAGNNYIFDAIDQLTGIEYTIEPDASSASYFLAMGALNGQITVNNLSDSSLQGDRDFAKVLAQMGANVTYANNHITVKHGLSPLKAITVNMEAMPDVAMTIAVIALFANGTTTINGIHSWKVKETDRLQAMYDELTKLGAKVRIDGQSITITPPEVIKADIRINTYNDHRMAMCFSLLAFNKVPVIINDYKCVGKTFVNYFEVLRNIAFNG